MNNKIQILAVMTLFIFTSVSAIAQKLSDHEISINGFRNPSVGAEYRYKNFSIHGGYYPTAFESGVTTKFAKAGLTYWFLPVGKKENPSSFYTTVAYARGLSQDYKGKNALIGEVGFRWMVWKGLNLRMGVAALGAKGESVKINPTPGISYSFFF
jgi:hypothetical protein